MPQCTTPETIGRQFGVGKNAIIRRFKKLGVEPFNLNHKLYFLNSDIDLLREKKRISILTTTVERFHIIEYFLSNKHNGSKVIADFLDISVRKVDRVISDYFNAGSFVVIQSKL